MEKEGESMKAFDMGALITHLPRKRGLSRYYSGKARSLACVGDARCVEDLKKVENPDPKKRKMDLPILPHYPCRPVPAAAHCAAPCVGV